MKSKGIRISDTEKWGTGTILGVSPIDILEMIDDNNNMKWAILELEATGDLGEKKWEQLDGIQESERGYWIEWKDLKDISKKFWQVIWMTIIGSKDEKNLHFYESGFTMYESCEIVIEIIDGGYCEVFSHDHQLIDKIAKKFKDIEYLEPDWNKNQLNS